jgi:hypothetical protein
MKTRIRLNKKVALMAYVDAEQHEQLKKYCEDRGLVMSQIVREGVEMRLNAADQFVAGFNKAIQESQKKVLDNRLAQMRFPDGRSFADIIINELETLRQGI